MHHLCPCLAPLPHRCLGLNEEKKIKKGLSERNILGGKQSPLPLSPPPSGQKSKRELDEGREKKEKKTPLSSSGVEVRSSSAELSSGGLQMKINKGREKKEKGFLENDYLCQQVG